MIIDVISQKILLSIALLFPFSLFFYSPAIRVSKICRSSIAHGQLTGTPLTVRSLFTKETREPRFVGAFLFIDCRGFRRLSIFHRNNASPRYLYSFLT